MRPTRIHAVAMVRLLGSAVVAAGCLLPDILGAGEPARGQAACSVPGERLVPSRLPSDRQWKLVWSDESSRVGNAHHFIFAATANRVP